MTPQGFHDPQNVRREVSQDTIRRETESLGRTTRRRGSAAVRPLTSVTDERKGVTADESEDLPVTTPFLGVEGTKRDAGFIQALGFSDSHRDPVRTRTHTYSLVLWCDGTRGPTD